MIYKDPVNKKHQRDERDIEVEYKPYQGKSEGVYVVENLDHYIRKYVKARTCPWIAVSEPHVLKSLTEGK